jgi:hypothetical protein
LLLYGLFLQYVQTQETAKTKQAILFRILIDFP